MTGITQAVASALERALREQATLDSGMEGVLRALPARSNALALRDLDWAGDAERCALSLIDALDAMPLPEGAEEIWLRIRLERWHERVEGCSIDVAAGAESDSYVRPLLDERWRMPSSLDAPSAARAARALDGTFRGSVLVAFSTLLAAEFFYRIDEGLLPGDTDGLGITAGFESGPGVHLGFHDGESLDMSGWKAFPED